MARFPFFSELPYDYLKFLLDCIPDISYFTYHENNSLLFLFLLLSLSFPIHSICVYTTAQTRKVEIIMISSFLFLSITHHRILLILNPHIYFKHVHFLQLHYKHLVQIIIISHLNYSDGFHSCFPTIYCSHCS